MTKRKMLSIDDKLKLGFTHKELLLINNQRREMHNLFGMKVWLISAIFLIVGMLYLNVKILAFGTIFLILTFYIQTINIQNRNKYDDEVIKHAFRKVKPKC